MPGRATANMKSRYGPEVDQTELDGSALATNDYIIYV